jgi:hypothetical protein
MRGLTSSGPDCLGALKLLGREGMNSTWGDLEGARGSMTEYVSLARSLSSVSMLSVLGFGAAPLGRELGVPLPDQFVGLHVDPTRVDVPPVEEFW